MNPSFNSLKDSLKVLIIGEHFAAVTGAQLLVHHIYRASFCT